jgi:hypothetical protein
MTVGDFNTPLSQYKQKDKKKKINKEPWELNDSWDQIDLTDIYTVFHLTTTRYKFSQQPLELSPK